MTGLTRLRRERLIQEAEGYLELLTGFSNWRPREKIRDELAGKALERLNHLAVEDQDHPYVLFLRGQLLSTMECYEEAIEPLDRSAKLDPHNLHAFLALGWCYKRAGRLQMAIRSLEDALIVASDEAIVHYNLACYFSLAGRTESALAHLAHAFQIDPAYRLLVPDETDFDPIREHPAFQELTSVPI